MHSSKGLEFGLVVIPMLGQMPDPREDEADEARLLYVAMTRAIDRLLMTYQQASDFTQRVQKAIGGGRSELREAPEARGRTGDRESVVEGRKGEYIGRDGISKGTYDMDGVEW